MPREKGVPLASTSALRENIIELCKTQPQTYQDLRLEFGMTYKTVFNHVAALIANGQLSIKGRKDGRDLIIATNIGSIPHIPMPDGSANPVGIVETIYHKKGNYVSKLERLDRKWGQVICGIFRTAVIIKQEQVFPKERHEEYKVYLRTYREELAVRLAQVNAFLQTEKFWTEEGLRDFQLDPAFNPDWILAAYSYTLQPEPEKKVE